jgi:hypothetical protein
MSAFRHPGITAKVTRDQVILEADSAALSAWATRPGSAWPCSELRELDKLTAWFDSNGLADLVVRPWSDPAESDDLPGDEFSAFCADALLAELPTNHPAFTVAVRQHVEPEDVWEAEAREIGREAGKAAGSWAADGNTDPEGARRLVAMLDDGDPAAYDRLPDAPNLSGEWADDPTPLSLARDITGEDYPDPELMDRLAEAFDEGVGETFEQACERELRTAAGLD